MRRLHRGELGWYARRAVVIALEDACNVLDRIPARDSATGRWCSGGWGCHYLRLSEASWRLDEHWSTGVWLPDRCTPSR